jgi:hypothetical protein
MYRYWLTFRLEYSVVNRRSYEDRYHALTATVRTNAPTYWDEPTSFIAFNSLQRVLPMARALQRAIEPEADMFVLRCMDEPIAYLCGANCDPDIFKLMPYLRVLQPLPARIPL